MLTFKIYLSEKDKDTLKEFIRDLEFEKDHLILILFVHNEYDIVRISRIVNDNDDEFVRFRFRFSKFCVDKSLVDCVETMGTTVEWLKNCVSIGEPTAVVEEFCNVKLIANCLDKIDPKQTTTELMRLALMDCLAKMKTMQQFIKHFCLRHQLDFDQFPLSQQMIAFLKE